MGSRDRDRSKERDRDRDRYRDKERERERDRERDRDKREKDRSRSRSRERDRYKDKERDRDRSRERDRNRDRERDSERDRNRDNRDRDRDSERDRNRDKDRDRERERDRDKREKDRYKDRSRSRSKEREREREREREKEKERKDKYDEKDKKKRKYDESDSDSDSSDSNKLSKDEMKKLKDEKKRQKELMKQNETPEERRKRRLEKRAKKDEKLNRTTNPSASAERVMSGYSNSVNPFNDSNLTDKFVWKAKKEKLLKGGMDPEYYEQRYEKNRKSEIQDELEKAKKRREEREREQELWEQEKDRLQRLKDSENNDELTKKEEEFHLLQAKMKSEKRINEGRPRPIDMLYNALYMVNIRFQSQQTDPSRLFSVLELKALEELDDCIREFEYLDLKNEEFWVASHTLAEYEINKKNGVQDAGADTGGVHQSLTTDITKILDNKNHSELLTLESQINVKLQSGSAMNVEYWETLLKHLLIYKAKALIRETFIKNLEAKITDIDTDQYITNIRNQIYKDDGTSTTNNGNNDSGVTSFVNEDGFIINQETFEMKDKSSREVVLTGNETEEDLYRIESEKFMDEEREEKFDNEVELASKHYAWHDKYRPRKPKFYNRVHSGYDWSKYNQTHYDHDNPPPKIVQGYKFNIFYPDLIDKTKSPTYFVESTDDGSDTKILRFHAGPPYEDIAFRIVDREWEKSHRKGYKCVFERGVLHVWFNFKRYRYRR